MLSSKQRILSNYILFTLENDSKAVNYAKQCGLGCGSNVQSTKSTKPHFLLSHLVESTVDYYLNDGLRGRALRSKLRKEYGVPILLIMQFAWLIIQIVTFIIDRWNSEKSLLNNQAVHQIFADNFGSIEEIWQRHEGYTMRDAVEHFISGLNTNNAEIVDTIQNFGGNT